MIELVQVCELFNITLKKKIQIKSWNIRATIAFPEKIDYILAILHHVVEMKSQANVKSLSSELLGSGNASILINEKNGSFHVRREFYKTRMLFECWKFFCHIFIIFIGMLEHWSHYLLIHDHFLV